VENILNTIATDYSGTSPANELSLNEIGEVVIKLSKAIYFDKYEEHKSNGSFILIDVATNTTAAVGFIQ
jgi:sulfate adenylyltransferase subunit 1